MCDAAWFDYYHVVYLHLCTAWQKYNLLAKRHERVWKFSNLTDTREAAYLNAITAAGILYSVTTACSSGVLWQCHCDRTIRDTADDAMWQWGGCSDDIEYGYKKSIRFTRNKHISTDIKELILKHNNEAGRLVGFYFLTRHYWDKYILVLQTRQQRINFDLQKKITRFWDWVLPPLCKFQRPCGGESQDPACICVGCACF